MKNDVLKVICWVAGLIAVVFIIGKAIIDAMKISAEGQLAVVKAENEHKEKMADKFVAFQQQAFGSPICHVTCPNENLQARA